MTISTTTAKSRYAGDGATTSFPTGFMFLGNEHVKVILRRADGSETLWTEGSEYDLTGVGAPGGGTVTVSASPIDYTPAIGETLVIKLAIPAKQETSLPLGGAFPSTSVEAMSDLAALRDQQIEEALSRTVKFKETTALADVEFPEPKVGSPLGWNATGDALVNLEAIGRWQGDWETATDYRTLDVVRAPVTKHIYVCEVAHTSDEFATDLDAGKWSLAIDFDGAVADAEAAQVAAEAAQAAAEAAQAGIETALTDAETAEAGAQTAQTAAETARDKAQAWAEAAEDTPVEVGQYSALHHAAKAAASATAAALSGVPVGAVLDYAGSAAPAGFLLLNGDSIGSASSGADQASGAYEPLFTLLWEGMADSEAPVSGGRGVSAASDWSANKTLTLPDARGRTTIGSGAGSGLTARTHGDVGGEEAHTLTEAEMPSHNHVVKAGDSGGTAGPGFERSNYTTTQTSEQTGSDQAHNNMPPWLALNKIVRH